MKVDPNFDRTQRIDYARRFGDDRFFHLRSFNEQPRPHNKPLPYFRVGGTSKVQRFGSETHLSLEPRDAQSFTTIDILYLLHVRDHPEIFTKAHNKALSKVDDQLRTAESFFEDWYERKQAVTLLADVGKSLFNFVTGWKKPEYWKGIAKKSRPKDLPSAWLAYQFGVKPLLGGVDRALNILGQEMPVMKVNGSSMDTYERENFGALTYQGRKYGERNSETGTALVKIGCSVTGVNPNRALSGATGLNEPFSSAWNVIPWGWAVDYFVNVGEMLGNIENKHPGVTTSDWYVTTFAKCDVRSTLDYPRMKKVYEPYIYDILVKSYSYAYTGKFYCMTRSIGRPGYQLEFKFPPLGGNKMANLFAAIALTMSGKKGK